MKSTILLALFLATSAVAAPDASVALPDAGSADAGVSVMAMSPMAVSGDADGGVTMDLPGASSMVKAVFVGVKSGDWWLAAGALLVLVVGLLRTFGKRFHEWLPDNNIMDKPLLFLYDTKIGGWTLNWLTAVGGGIGFAIGAGEKVDFSLWKSVVMVSTSGTALVQLLGDIKEGIPKFIAWVKAWLEARKAAKAAKAAAAVVPGPPPAVAAVVAADPAKPVDPPKPGV